MPHALQQQKQQQAVLQQLLGVQEAPMQWMWQWQRRQQQRQPQRQQLSGLGQQLSGLGGQHSPLQQHGKQHAQRHVMQAPGWQSCAQRQSE